MGGWTAFFKLPPDERTSFSVFRDHDCHLFAGGARGCLFAGQFQVCIQMDQDRVAASEYRNMADCMWLFYCHSTHEPGISGKIDQ
jgi:hypothetical protein